MLFAYIERLMILKDENMSVNFIRNIGFILLAVFLILSGVVSLVPALAIPAIVFSILEIAAGIFILIGR